MKTQHTKGEWINLGYRVDVDVADGLSGICEMSDWMGNEQMVANAKLIAAAPEMLKALQCISSFVYDKSVKGCTYGDTNYDSESAVYGYNMCLDNLQEIANNAIKKATE